MVKQPGATCPGHPGGVVAGLGQVRLGLEACLQRFPIQYFREELKSCQLITFKLMKESSVLVEGTRGSFH